MLTVIKWCVKKATAEWAILAWEINSIPTTHGLGHRYREQSMDATHGWLCK